MSYLENALDMLIDDDGLPVPECEFRFHPTRRWRFDRAWPEYKVAVEVHGGIWSGGRHVRGKGFQGDCSKRNEAQCMGWIALDVTAHHIEHGKAIVWIRRALTGRGWNDGTNRNRNT